MSETETPLETVVTETSITIDRDLLVKSAAVVGGFVILRGALRAALRLKK